MQSRRRRSVQKGTKKSSGKSTFAELRETVQAAKADAEKLADVKLETPAVAAANSTDALPRDESIEVGTPATTPETTPPVVSKPTTGTKASGKQSSQPRPAPLGSSRNAEKQRKKRRRQRAQSQGKWNRMLGVLEAQKEPRVGISVPSAHVMDRKPEQKTVVVNVEAPKAAEKATRVTKRAIFPVEKPEVTPEDQPEELFDFEVNPKDVPFIDEWENFMDEEAEAEEATAGSHMNAPTIKNKEDSSVVHLVAISLPAETPLIEVEVIIDTQRAGAEEAAALSSATSPEENGDDASLSDDSTKCDATEKVTAADGAPSDSEGSGSDSDNHHEKYDDDGSINDSKEEDKNKEPAEDDVPLAEEPQEDAAKGVKRVRFNFAGLSPFSPKNGKLRRRKHISRARRAGHKMRAVARMIKHDTRRLFRAVFPRREKVAESPPAEMTSHFTKFKSIVRLLLSK